MKFWEMSPDEESGSNDDESDVPDGSNDAKSDGSEMGNTARGCVHDYNVDIVVMGGRVNQGGNLLIS